MNTLTLIQQQQSGQAAITPKPLGIEPYWPAEAIAAALGADPAGVRLCVPFVSAALSWQGIADEPTEIAALATIRVEVGYGFRPINEYGDDAYFTRMYEGRADLGNTEQGDGARYHGRGWIQLTGRANYRYYGEQLNIDLEADPERALDPYVSAAVLAVYFANHGGGALITAAAAAGDWIRVRELVNGGTNGLAAFLTYVQALEAL